MEQWPFNKRRIAGSRQTIASQGWKLPSNLIADVKDSFASIDSKWTNNGTTIDTGRARIEATSGNYTADLLLNAPKSLRHSQVHCKIEPAADGSDNSVETFFGMISNEGNDRVALLKSGNLLYFEIVTNDVRDLSVNTAYSAVNHVWWRLRESGGNVLYETAPLDKSVWTLQRTVTPVFPLYGMTLFFTAAFWGTPGAGPFYTYLDDLNL